MKRDLLSICLIATMLVLPACAGEPEPEPEPAAAEPVAAAPAPMSADPSGSWAGDWGMTPTHRNDVTLELTWDGTTLTGTVNPGPDAIEIHAATFDPANGAISMEADVGEVHFAIDGAMDGDTMSGSWNHDDREGDFSITKGE
jgi:hypothetical protein